MHELIHDFIPPICSWPLRLEREMFFERRSLVERGGRRDFVRDKDLTHTHKRTGKKRGKRKKRKILLKLTFAPVRECCSIRSGASGQPYYCTPLLCVSDVIELLVVWQYNKPKSRKNTNVKKRIHYKELPENPHYGFGPVHTSLCVWVTWDWWLGHLPRSPRTDKGADWWSWPMDVEAEGVPRVCHGE